MVWDGILSEFPLVYMPLQHKKKRYSKGGKKGKIDVYNSTIQKGTFCFGNPTDHTTTPLRTL